ncbi:hypothetical protein ACS0TY_011909 [Phlomoides rotata]
MVTRRRKGREDSPPPKYDDGVEEAIDVEVGYETIDEGVGNEAIDVEVGNETINEGVGNEDDDVTDGRADWMMTRFQKCRDRANTKWEGRYPPKIRQILVKNMEMVGDCIPIKSNNRFYQIEFFDGKQFAVDLGMRTCSCSSWNLSGIPCNHAISAITNENLDPEDFLDDCYNIETYKRVYAPAILPIAGQTEWAPTLFIPPMPPNFGKKLGRPSSSRFTGIGDTKNVKKGKVLKLKKRHIESKCTTCRTSGHNSRSCPQSENARRQKRKVTRIQGNGADAQADCEDVEAQGEDTQAQGEDAQAVGEDAQAVSEDAQPTTQVVTGPSMSEPPTKGKKRGRPPKSKETTTATHDAEILTDGITLLPPRPTSGLVDEDDTEFEALLSQAMLNQDSCDVLSLGMKAVHCKVGPTPFQQLYEDYTSPYVPKMFSGPNIRAPPPFVHGGSRPQFTTQSQKESGMKRILVDGGQKFMDLTQESHAFKMPEQIDEYMVQLQRQKDELKATREKECLPTATKGKRKVGKANGSQNTRESAFNRLGKKVHNLEVPREEV